MEKRTRERRKVNQAVGDERRGKAVDRRRCPQCGSSVRSHAEHAPGGSLQRRYCTKCGWEEKTRQVDESRLKALAGFELTLHGSMKKAILELEPDFLKASGFTPGDTLELKAIYAPGKDKKNPISWVLKKTE
jgi:ribosomal protein S27AE